MTAAIARTIAPQLARASWQRSLDRTAKQLREHEHEQFHFFGVQVDRECGGGSDDYCADDLEHPRLCRVPPADLQSCVVHGPDRIRHRDVRSRYPKRLISVMQVRTRRRA